MKVFSFPFPGQQRVLFQLRRKSQTPQEIALELTCAGIQTDASLVRSVLTKLERKGLVGNRPHGKRPHGRQWYLLDLGGHLVDFIARHGESKE